jgi:hypothetical protein
VGRKYRVTTLKEIGMRVGMLWFDNSGQRDLDAKLERAIAHYEAKYGARPTVCYVHPSMLLSARHNIAGLDLRGSNMILPHHFWLGVEDEVEQRSAA